MSKHSDTSWKSLKEQHDRIRSRSILSLFEDPARFENFSASSGELLLDFSKTNICDATLNLLEELALSCDVEKFRDAMFGGEPINNSEGRAALHTLLRAPYERGQTKLLSNANDQIAQTRSQIEQFTMRVLRGDLCTSNGLPFKNILSVGIGGSDLGPLMVTRALSPYAEGLPVHFLSNVDGSQVWDTLKELDPRNTLVLIMSKAFNTAETIKNAQTIKNWLKSALGEEYRSHLVAVTTAPQRAIEFGVYSDRVFTFGEHIGGRYSLWGPVGLPIMLNIGVENFSKLLSGAHAMDEHFRTTPIKENLPMLMGLIGVWHRSICSHPTRAVVPYDQRLEKLIDYLQQLDMESNGKGVNRYGEKLARSSGPVVFGAAGTNGQHAFFQMLHQGTDIIPVEFLIAAESHEPELKKHHEFLKASCLAQSEALMRGRSYSECLKNAHERGYAGDNAEAMAMARMCPGNRPSITLAYPKLTPEMLGQIIALYEHRVFVEATIWEINPFDQWGVELGKELTSSILPLIRGETVIDTSPSTYGLMRKLTN